MASDKGCTETIVIVGTLDTKGQEVSFLKEEIEKRGCQALVMDVGVLGQPSIAVDCSRNEIAELGGKKLEDLSEAARRGANRSNATAVMMKGAAEKVKALFSQRRLQGVIALGGSTGTAIGTSTMKVLPIGIPKMMITTRLALAGEMGEKDITVMQTPADILGLNRIMKQSLRQAAAAMVGMVKSSGEQGQDLQRPMVGITALGVTTPLVMKVIKKLETCGYEVIIFHNRVGNLEELVEAGSIKGIIDISPGELVWAFAANMFPERKSRLDILNRVSVPMIFVPGSLDMIILRKLGPDDVVPKKYKGRPVSQHGPLVTLVATNLKELKILGEAIAKKANASRGPVRIVIPLRGFSSMDKEGQLFYNPARVQTFLKSVKAKVEDRVQVIEVDAHINDDEFAERLCDVYLSMEGKT